MKYALWRMVLGRVPKIELTRTRYLEIATSLRGIYEIVGIEDEWDSVIENYVELESAILNIALRDMVSIKDESQMYRDRRTVSRKLSNFLSSCRAFFDRSERKVSKLAKDIKGLDISFKKFRQKSYDSSLAFRLMEALRNYSQHSSAPLHGIVYDGRWMEDRDPKALRHTIGVYINTKILKSDRNFKSSVLDELIKKDEKIPLLNVIRLYLRSLSEIRENLQKEMELKEKEWLSNIDKATDEYKAISGGDALGLGITEFDADGRIVKEDHFVPSTFEALKGLRIKNRKLVNFELQYVSSELTQKWVND